MVQITGAAVSALRAGIIGWRHRWTPPHWQGRTIAEVLATRPTLSSVDAAVAVIDRDALEHNLAAMARWCAQHRVDLAPHAKTTMAPPLIEQQIRAGAWGVTVANLGQARVMRAFGVSPIVVANEVVDRAHVRWLAGEMRRDPSFRLLCWVDSAAGAGILAAEMRAAAAPGPLDVLVEMGMPGGRTGCRTVDQAVDVARAAVTSGALRVVGVCGYEGIVPSGAGGVEQVDRFLRTMREAARRLEPYFPADTEVILSAGGSAYFDRVAVHLGPDTLDRPTRTVLRSGCYLTHDAGHYAELTPAARQAEGAPRFINALRVIAPVVSRPEPGLALLAVGRRDVPYDQGLPIPLDRREWSIKGLNDQHAYLTIGEDDELDPGDQVTLGISHPCTLFDRWNLLPLVTGDTIVDLVPTYF